MTDIVTVLMLTGMLLAIVGLAVFICALSDKLQGRKPNACDESETLEESPEPAPRQTWWQHLMLLPLYVVLVPMFLALGSCIALPVMFLELVWHWGAKARSRFFRSKVQRV